MCFSDLVLDVTATGIVPIVIMDTQHPLFDCCWSELNEDLVLGACGDGSVKLWDVQASLIDPRPIRVFHEHLRDVFSVHWNCLDKSIFVSGAFDSVKLWSLDSSRMFSFYSILSYFIISYTILF